MAQTRASPQQERAGATAGVLAQTGAAAGVLAQTGASPQRGLPPYLLLTLDRHIVEQRKGDNQYSQQPQPLTSPRKLAKSLIKIIDIFTEKYTTTISRCKKKASQLTLAQKISDFLLDIRKIKAGTKISGAKLDFKLSKCQETLEKYKESVLLYQERVYKADDDSKNLMDSWEDSVDPVPSSKEELLHNTNIAQPIYCFFRDPECCSVE